MKSSLLLSAVLVAVVSCAQHEPVEHAGSRAATSTAITSTTAATRTLTETIACASRIGCAAYDIRVPPPVIEPIAIAIDASVPLAQRMLAARALGVDVVEPEPSGVDVAGFAIALGTASDRAASTAIARVDPVPRDLRVRTSLESSLPPALQQVSMRLESQTDTDLLDTANAMTSPGLAAVARRIDQASTLSSMR